MSGHLCPASGNLATNIVDVATLKYVGRSVSQVISVKRSRSSSFAFGSQCIGHSLIARAPLCAAFCDRWRSDDLFGQARLVIGGPTAVIDAEAPGSDSKGEEEDELALS